MWSVVAVVVALLTTLTTSDPLFFNKFNGLFGANQISASGSGGNRPSYVAYPKPSYGAPNSYQPFINTGQWRPFDPNNNVVANTGGATLPVGKPSYQPTTKKPNKFNLGGLGSLNGLNGLGGNKDKKKFPWDIFGIFGQKGMGVMRPSYKPLYGSDKPVFFPNIFQHKPKFPFFFGKPTLPGKKPQTGNNGQLPTYNPQGNKPQYKPSVGAGGGTLLVWSNQGNNGVSNKPTYQPSGTQTPGNPIYQPGNSQQGIDFILRSSRPSR